MFQTFQHTESCTWCILVSRWHSYYGKWLGENRKGLSGLSACKCCCFKSLLAAKLSTGVTWSTLTCNSCLCRSEKFLVVSYCVCSYKLFYIVLLQYPYLEEYYKAIPIDLSKQQKLDADSKAIQ